SNGAPFPAGGFNPKEGAISMGFYNMNTGDAAIFKSLADQYAISDNYHQAVMGGTGSNFQALVSGHAVFFTDTVKLDGSPAIPFANQIENPNPAPNTNNYYTQDGYAGGSYVNCADLSQPGVAAVDDALRDHGIHERNCAPGHYYLVNNYNMYWKQTSANPQPLITTTSRSSNSSRKIGVCRRFHRAAATIFRTRWLTTTMNTGRTIGQPSGI